MRGGVRPACPARGPSAHSRPPGVSQGRCFGPLLRGGPEGRGGEGREASDPAQRRAPVVDTARGGKERRGRSPGATGAKCDARAKWDVLICAFVTGDGREMRQLSRHSMTNSGIIFFKPMSC